RNRIAEAQRLDTIDFIGEKKATLEHYLNNDAVQFLPALKTAIDVIDGFESPYGMELLATVDWLITKERCEPTLGSIRAGLQRWPDRKSTRLNSSHVSISYAVFCSQTKKHM